MVASESIEQILVGARYAFPLSDAYGSTRKRIPTTFGVYVIRCADGRIYVGSTSQRYGFRARIAMHLYELRARRHRNERLQHAFDDFGLQSFTCFILEETSKADATAREQIYITQWTPFLPEVGFNKSPTAFPCGGGKRTETSLRNMHRGQRNLSPAVKEKKRQILVARNKSPEMRAAKFAQKAFAFERDGVVVKGVNITQFAQEHYLGVASLSEVRKGTKRQHRGWTLPGQKLVWHSVSDPCGNIHRFCNITGFAKEHRLNLPLLRALLFGKRMNYKGWILST